MSFKLSDYSFVLPHHTIAQNAKEPAHNSKLLYIKVDKQGTCHLEDHHFTDMINLITKGNMLIANNSQVFAARIPLHHAKVLLSNRQETTLEIGEILIVRLLFDKNMEIDQQQCVIWGSDKKNFKPGSIIFIDKAITCHMLSFVEDGILVKFQGLDLKNICEKYGEMPLPPYITYHY